MIISLLKYLALTKRGRWSRCFNLAGRPAGLRFYCADCRVLIPYGAPPVVFHCGKVEVLKKWCWQRLPVFHMRQIGTRLPETSDGTIIFCR